MNRKTMNHPNLQSISTCKLSAQWERDCVLVCGNNSFTQYLVPTDEQTNFSLVGYMTDWLLIPRQAWMSRFQHIWIDQMLSMFNKNTNRRRWQFKSKWRTPYRHSFWEMSFTPNHKIDIEASTLTLILLLDRFQQIIWTL